MAIGRPITLSPNVATKRISVAATANQTAFTPAGGYRVNEIAVYRNGSRLVDGHDFTATDGVTVTLLSAATIDDIIEFTIFDSYNVADAISSNGDSTLNGNLTITGFCSAATLYGDGSNITGIGVTSTTVTDRLYVIGLSTQVGMSTFKSDVYIAGITTVGTALSLADDVEARFGNAGDLRIYHDGSNSYIHDGGTGDLKIQGASDVIIENTAGANSAVFNTDGSVELYYRGASAGKKLETTTSGVIVSGVTTSTTSVVGSAVTINSTGIDAVSGVITASSFVGNVTGNCSGSSGSATGNAGGLTGTPDIAIRNITGVAATFTGVLTYEDVTSVDSVGLITARSGIQFGAAGVGGTITGAGAVNIIGISTFESNVEFGQAGVGGTIRANGDTTLAGVVTATKYYGDGSELTGVVSGIEVKDDGSSVGTSLTAINFSGATVTTAASGITTVTIPSASLSSISGTASGIVTTLFLSSAQDHKLTATGLCTITCSGGTEGESHTLRVINSGATNIGFSSYFLFPGGSNPSLPTADGAISLISFTVNQVGAGGTQLLAGASLNYS